MSAPSANAIYAAAALITAISLWSSLDFYSALSASSSAPADEYQISVHRERLGVIRSLVPESAVIEYVSDVELKDTPGLAAFYAAQYVLSPRLLTPLGKAPNAEWVLANYNGNPETAELERKANAKVFRRFDRGVTLLKRERPR